MRSWLHAAGLIVVIGGCLIGAFALTDPLMRLVRDITGGHRMADAAAGVLLFWVPVVLICLIAGFNERRRGFRPRDLWVVVLLVPALDLTPFSRLGTNTSLDHRINTQLPGFLGGLVTGVLVLAVPVLAYGIVLRLRGTGRSSWPRRPGRPGSPSH